GGRDFARTAKFRNVRANPKVALVIDDVLPPWRPRCVMVRGEAEALDEATGADGGRPGPIIRSHPSQVLSWGPDGTAARALPRARSRPGRPPARRSSCQINAQPCLLPGGTGRARAWRARPAPPPRWRCGW